MSDIVYKVKIKVREEGQSKGVSYAPFECASLKQCLSEINDFFNSYRCWSDIYPDIRITAEKKP